MGKKSVKSDIKWQILGLKRANTFSNVEIGKIIGVSEKCVRTTIRNYIDHKTVNDSPRPGRPSKLTKRDKKMIFRIGRINFKWSYKKIAEVYNRSRSNLSVSKSTIKNVLKSFGLGTYTATKKPMLTIKDRLKRLNWCRKRKYWTVKDWSNIIFSDESNFEVFNRKGRVLVKRFKNQRYVPRYVVPRLQGGGGSVGIWGCISFKGTGVGNIYTGRINQVSYIECLENCLLPSIDLLAENQYYTFQQDGASAHTAHTVTDWLARNDISVLEWCPRSPDLNPIENVWAWMDQQMSRTQISSISNLKEVLHETWLKVPIEMVQNLINSMPRRIEACIKAKGGHFRY